MTIPIGKNITPAMDDYYNYGLRNARIEKGYSMRQLAGLVGVTPSSVGSYERLRALPNPFIARRLARVLDRKISELFPKQLRAYVREIQQEREGYEHDALTHAVPLEDGLGLKLTDSSGEELPVAAETKELQRRLRKVFRTLSYREREIIKLRYGIGDGFSYTLDEVGNMFKATRERIRQIEAKAVRKLQQPSRSQELVGFLDN